MSESLNFPTVMPSLLLDFANRKSLDPRITFTRASTATYYDEDTVALAEQNLLTYSQEFDNAIWVKAGQGVALAPTITANYATAPDGTATADRAQFSLNGGTTTSDISRLSQTITVASGVTAVFSVWICSTDGVSSYEMQIVAPNGSGVAVTVTGTWTRFTATAASGGTASYAIRLRGGFSPTNANTADVLVWGAQLEQRSAVTAYTPTTTAPITNYIPVLMTAAVGVPRFDFNPTTRESLGLLIEEQRTNLLTYSDDFANATWTKTRSSITANTIVAPDGTLTGDKLVEDTTASNSHFVGKSATVSNGVSYTFSVCLKGDGIRGWAALLCIGSTATNNTWFDLVNGVVGSVSPNATASITNLGNGWYRCSITVISNTTTINSYVTIATANNVASYTGDGYSGLFIWGAQLEAGAFPTSYIPTVASSATRSTDAASMTGVSFSEWYKASEGTIFAEAATPASGAFRPIAYFSDATSSNIIGMGQTTGGAQSWAINVATVSQVSLTSGAIANTTSKTAAVYKVNDFAMSLNAGAAVTDTSGTLPNITTFQIGADQSNRFLSGTIKKIAYYPWRLTNAQLQALTS